ncbi:hypothetical protein KC324_g1043 [Hortaea werneckii]|nr:hypothetical protein KC324_g1043 [Hortaea werneckii]
MKNSNAVEHTQIKNQIDGFEEDRISKPDRPLPAGRGEAVEGFRFIACMMIWAMFATTGHAQDFRDRSADALMGRKTIALLLPPRFARGSLAVLIVGWTAFLVYLWRPPVIASQVFAALGIRTALRYISSEDEKDDYVSYVWFGC